MMKCPKLGSENPCYQHLSCRSQRFISALSRIPKRAVRRVAVFGFTRSSFTNCLFLIWVALTETVPRA